MGRLGEGGGGWETSAVHMKEPSSAVPKEFETSLEVLRMLPEVRIKPTFPGSLDFCPSIAAGVGAISHVKCCKAENKKSNRNYLYFFLQWILM